jgi:hypothetical protein
MEFVANIYPMVTTLSPLVAGVAFLFLGRWMYRNPTAFRASSLYANPQHPFLIGFRRVLATIFIFGGSLGIVAALVSHRIPGPLAFFVSVVGGIAGALLLRPRVEELFSPRTRESPSATMMVDRDFLSKRGKWALGISVGVVVLFFVGGIGFISNAIGNSEVCRLAVQQAQSNSAVAERIGQPIKRGLVVGGDLSSASANLWIPLSGPKGDGTLYAVAVRSMGVWKFETLQLAVRGDLNRVDLLKGLVPQNDSSGGQGSQAGQQAIR